MRRCSSLMPSCFTREYWRPWRARHGLQYSRVKQLGISEEQRRIPAEEHKAGNEPGVGVTLEIVVTANAVHTAQHCEVWSPPVPQELDDGDSDSQPDAGDRTQHGNTSQTNDRKPEFPTLDAVNAP